MSAPRDADHPDPVYVAAAAARLARAQAQLEAQRRQVDDYLARAIASAVEATR
jgi:hypothetical protein